MYHKHVFFPIGVVSFAPSLLIFATPLPQREAYAGIAMHPTKHTDNNLRQWQFITKCVENPILVEMMLELFFFFLTQ